MRRNFTRALAALALAGSALAGGFSGGLERHVAGKPDGEAITVLLALREQADVFTLDQQLHERRAPLAERHEQVVSLLMRTAARSQAGLLDELRALKAQGKVGGYTPYWIVNGIVVNAPIAELRRLAARPDVEVAEANLVASLIEPVTPAKPLDPRPQGDSRTPEPGITAVRAPDVWNLLGVTGAGALVGGIDTGVLGTHTALSSRWRGNNGHPVGQCWLDAAGLGHSTPQDGNGHGTHTMGTMVGGAPGLEIGVAPGAQWIASNCINMGTGAAFDNAVIASFQFMTDPDGNPGTVDDVPDVVQNSWGVNESFSGYLNCDSRWWTAIDNCEAAGVCVTWSAGNEGPSSGTLRSPADRAVTPYNCFSVGAVSSVSPYSIASFSSRGPSTCSPAPYPVKPEVSAPGVSVYSSYNSGGYVTMDGTSMAGPHVAGVVALMRSANPNVDVTTIKQVLMSTATDLGTAGEDNTYGWGLVDAYDAVIAVMTGYGTVSGVVSDLSTGLPVAGATVQNTSGSQSATTGGSGSYSLFLPMGPRTLACSAFGYTAQNVGVTVVENATVTANIALSPAPTALLSGVVYGPDANPIVGAIIDFTNAPIADVVTGAGGAYAVSIPTGYSYNLTASAPGVGSQSQSITFNGAQTLDFNLPVNPQFLPTGPDSYGYRIFDSNDAGGLPYVWNNIAGTLIASGSDDITQTVTVPFSFKVYGVTYTQLGVSSNGFLLPGSSTASAFTNAGLPETTLPASICGLWDDLNPTVGGGIYYEYQPANGRFVVEYENVPLYSGAAVVNMQIHLLDPVVYPTPTGDAAWIVYYQSGSVGSHTTGLDNAAGTVGLQYVYNGSYDVHATPFSASPLALLITTNPAGYGAPAYPEIAVTPLSLSKTLAPEDSGTETLTISNSGQAQLNWSAAAATALEGGRNAGGPDAFGYRWKDSNEPGGPAYTWFDISAVGTSVGTGDNVSFGPFNLGFSFPFYGNSYSTVRICSNGFLSFTSTNTTSTNPSIPNAANPNNVVAPFWDNLNVTTAGMLRYYADGANQRFIVQWTAVPKNNSSNYETFQVVLRADGTILYYYHTMNVVNSATVGIENSSGTVGLQVVYNAAYITNGLAVQLSTATPWLSVAPASGNTAAGGASTLTATFNAAGLAVGTYQGSITITSNDPDEATTVIPVTLTVTPPDSQGPAIGHICLGDTWDDQPRPLAATISDPSGVASATLHYGINGGGEQSQALAPAGGDLWTGSLPGVPAPGTVAYHLSAVDASSYANSTVSPPCAYDLLVLGAPVAVISNPADGTVVLSWTAVPGATSYSVFETDSYGGAANLVLSTAATSVTLPTLVDSRRIYTVRSVH